MAGWGARVTGIQTTMRAISKAKKEDAIRIADGIRKIMEVIGNKADYYCPKVTLKLVKSKKIEVTGAGLHTRGSISYGGPEAPYGLFVHEDMNNAHADPTCAKFLERAIRETRGTCANIIKRSMAGETTKLDTGRGGG